MARFVFRLASVLEQRRRAEDVAKRALAERVGVSTKIRERITGMQQTVRDSKQGLRESLSGSVQAAQVGRLASHAQLTAVRGQRAVLELAAAEQQVAVAREALREAIAARRAIELLEERERAAWKKRLQKREDAEMDDLSSRRVFDQRTSETRSAGEGVVA
ncbi:MAG: flagellar export protein FliJ [Planctomycetota bacterium]